MNSRQKLVQQQFLDNEERIIRRLNQVYAQALKDINANIERLMERFDPVTGDLPQSAIYQLKYQKMLKGQLEGIMGQMQTKQYLTVSDYLNECYEDGFLGSLFDLHGQGIPLTIPINQEALVRAVQLESKISEGLYTRLGEDAALLKKKITAQVSRAIATGSSFSDCAVHLAGQTRIGYNKAIRIARTEGHRIQSAATMDAAYEAKARGADLVKEWDATLDGKTRESHVAVDGEIRELDEPFSNGLDYPGDPAGGAAEVVNCRCAVLQRARWALGGSFTKWNNFTKQLETFESPESYGEFKKGFFSDGNKVYMNYVQRMQDKYHTRDWSELLDRMTDAEYKHVTNLARNNPLFNKETKKAVDVASLRSEIQTIMSEIERVKSQIRFTRRSLYSAITDKAATNAKIDALQQQLNLLEDQSITKGRVLVENMNATFKVATDNDDFIRLILNLERRMDYNEVLAATDRTMDEIIRVLGGGDNTDGSCASVGLAYIGQRSGWDVLDFRGGSSMTWFSDKMNKINMWDVLGVNVTSEDSAKTNLTNGKRILSMVETGKEYYLSVGRHAAIVRRNDNGTLQYLELQSPTACGWEDFSKDIGGTLKARFGCSSSSNYYSTAYLTDIASVANNNAFRTILGYINTSESTQRKGLSGTIK